ncbi:sperm acrosome-associated protein [Pimephales promelas]|nr:sperm acrosome-associated protein [Pimephales promelas]
MIRTKRLCKLLQLRWLNGREGTPGTKLSLSPPSHRSKGVLKHLESSRSIQNTSCESLDTCREILGPNSNISQLRAHYPHNEINRLSCDEARNYGGIVSVIPLALDLLTTYYSKGLNWTNAPTAAWPVFYKALTVLQSSNLNLFLLPIITHTFELA